MPYYRTQESQERPWYENLGSVDFWADGILKNMGFVVGAVYSGSLYTKLLKGAGMLAAGNSLGALLAGSTFSAVNEARIQANNNAHDSRMNITNILDQGRQDAIQRINNDPYMTEEQKYKALDDVDINYQNELARADDQIKTMGNMDMALNIPLLMADNFYTFGKFYSKGFDTAKQQTRKSVMRAANEAYAKGENPLTAGVQQATDNALYNWRNISKGRAIGRGLMTGVREGNEELAQSFIDKYTANDFTDSPDSYYKAISNPRAEREA